MLVSSLQLVALPAPAQRRSVPNFVCIEDEVSCGFGEAFLLVPSLAASALLSPETECKLRDLDAHFSAMPRSDADFMSADGFDTHEF